MSKSITVTLPSIFNNIHLPEKISLTVAQELWRYCKEIEHIPNAAERMVCIPELDIQGLLPYNIEKNCSIETPNKIIGDLVGNDRYDFICIRKGCAKEYRVPSSKTDIYPGELDITLGVYRYVVEHPEILEEFGKKTSESSHQYLDDE